MKTLLILTLLFLPVMAQDNKKPEAPAKKAEHSLDKDDLAKLQAFREQNAMIESDFATVNAQLDKILTDEQKIALVTKLQLARVQSRGLNSAFEAWQNDLRKKYKCATCVVSGDKFLEPPDKKDK